MIYPDELETFRAFKRAGHIPRTAQIRLYRLVYGFDNTISLWRMDKFRPVATMTRAELGEACRKVCDVLDEMPLVP